MTVTIAYAATDGYLTSEHSTYTTMVAGSSLAVVSGTSTLKYGRDLVGGVYHGFQPFLTFTHSLAADHRVAAAYFQLRSVAVTNAGTSRNLRFSQFAYGTIGTADWRTSVQLSALPEVAEWSLINGSAGKYVHGGSDALAAAVQASGTLEVVAFTTGQLAGTAPTQDETATFYATEQGGTASDPALVYASVERSALWPVIGAQAQLADGSWAYLQSDAASDPAITIKHATTGGTVSTIATLPTGSGGTEFDVGDTIGYQGLALVIDGADHLYVIGKVGNANNSLAAKAYTKGVGYTWSAQTTRTWPLVSYDTAINGCAAAYHSTASGTIMAVFGHGPGLAVTGTTGNELAYALLNATYLRTGAGALMRDHDSVITAGLQAGTLHPSSWNAYANEVGAGLDVVAGAGANTAWGWLASFTKEQAIGANIQVRPGRYIVNATGDAFTHTSTHAAGYAAKAPQGKTRTVRTSSSTVAFVSADSDAGYGLSVVVLQYSGVSSGVELAYDALADNGITNMPDGPAISVAAWWDAVYNSVSNTLEIYYRDSVSARILRRTTFSLTTMLALNNSSIVTTLASGTAEIQAVRVQRGSDAATSSLVCVASEDAGVKSLTNVIDTFNLEPNAPTLTAKANYDATTAGVFNWTFNDPNAGDTQSAYEFEVYRTDTGASVIDTGKVVSATASRTVSAATLTNGLSYRWRVRTWDVADTVGPFSGYGTFSTAAGGTVTITDPVADNPAGVITDDYGIDWSVAGTTQAAYRVWLKTHSSGATVNDSGWITSTATTYNVTGMTSGTEHRVEVKVRNAGLVESATGTRLITPDFGSPEVPTIAVSAEPIGGYVLVSVTNPAPTGDKPEVSANQILRRPVGTSTYSVIGECGPDGEYRDYTAASGVAYEFVARGTA
jgi:hypothetical protein